MSIYFIHATSRYSDVPIKSEEEIKGYFFWLNGNKGYLRKADMANAYKSGDRYFTYRTNDLPKTECTWKKSINGEWFLQSNPNYTSKDNLLSLPVIQE